MNNLFVSYDLYRAGQDYGRISTAIKALGNAVKVHKSFWYVRSSLDAGKAVERLRQAVDGNDTVVVVDATNDNCAWHNLPADVAEFLRKQWNANGINSLAMGLGLRQVMYR